MSRLVKHIKTATEKFDVADGFARNGMSGRLEIQTMSRFAKDYGVGDWVTQGFAPIPDSQIGFIFLRNGDDTSCTIYKVNYVTGELLATKSGLTGLGHVNDATYNQRTGTVDVCAASGIARINKNTLEIDSILDPDHQVYTGLSYDLVLKCLYGRNGYTFFKLDPYTCEIQSNNVADEPQVLKDRIASGLCVRQGSMARDGKIAIVYNAPDVIVVYNYEGSDYTTSTPYVYRIYELPLKYNNGQLLSEVEGGDFTSESEIALVENCNLVGYKNLSKIIKVDLSKNVLSGTLFSQMKATPTTTENIYCDATTTCNIPDGSQDRPFRYIEEAVYCALAKYGSMVTINLMTAGDYGLCYINGLASPLRIIGVSGAIINGIHLERVTSVDFRTFTVKSTGLLANTIELNQATCYFNGVTFEPPTTKANYYMNIVRSNMYCTGSNNAASLTKDNAFNSYLIHAEKASKVGLYSFSTSGLGTYVYADTASEVYTRPSITSPVELHNGAYANPSMIQIAERQSITPGGTITLSNTDLLGGNALNYMHNKIHFEFTIHDVGVSSEHVLLSTGYFGTNGIINTGGVYYQYIINMYVKISNPIEIKSSRVEVYQVPSPTASSYSPGVKLGESSKFWPSLWSITVSRD